MGKRYRVAPITAHTSSGSWSNGRAKAGPFFFVLYPVLSREGCGSTSVLAEYERQIVRGHLMEFRLPKPVQRSATGDILDMA